MSLHGFFSPRPTLAALAALLALALGRAPAFAANPLFFSDYDGAADRVLARSNAGEIRERDLFLFMAMRQYPLPDVVDRYETEPVAARREELREYLHRALEDYLIMQAAAGLDLAARYPRIDDKAQELLLYPVYDIVWTDRVVRKQMLVTVGDCRKFYDDHPELFTRRDTLTARVIFRKLGGGQSLEENAEQELLLAQLRDRVAAGEDFAAVAREFSQAPSAREGGLLPPMTEGEVFAEFEQAIEELEVGQVSQPFKGAGGLYLVKLEQRAPAVLPEFADVEQEAREILERRVLRFQYVYQLDKLAQAFGVACRPQAWQSKDDRDWLLKVGRAELNVGDFVRLHPRVLKPDCFTDTSLLYGESFRIFLGELTKRDLLKHGVLLAGAAADPRLQRARELAPALLKAERMLGEGMFAVESPTTDALRLFYARNIQSFMELPSRFMLKVSAQIKDPEAHPALERLDLIDQARAQMKTYLEVAVEKLRRIDREAEAAAKERQAAEEEARAAGQKLPAARDEQSTPALALKSEAFAETLELLDPKVYAVTLEFKTFIGEDYPDGVHFDEFDKAKAYDVLGPVDIEDEAVYWVCLGAMPLRIESFEKGYETVRDLYERLLAEEARERLLERILPLANVTWLYDQLPYRPRARRVEEAIRPLVVPLVKKKGSRPAL